MKYKLSSGDRIDHIEDRLHALQDLANEVWINGDKPLGCGMMTVAQDAIRDLRKVRKALRREAKQRRAAEAKT